MWIPAKRMIFSCFYPFGKAGGFQIPRCQGIAVKDYGVTLGALALKSSRFCDVGVNWPYFLDINSWCNEERGSSKQVVKAILIDDVPILETRPIRFAWQTCNPKTLQVRYTFPLW